MRKYRLTTLALAALLLTACASATDAAPLTTPTPEPTATSTPTPAAGDFAWLDRHNSSFNSGDAYYEMVYRNHGALLLKTDYATAAQTVACTVPGCTHDSADCPAWFPGRYSYYCPFVADGAVYVLNATLFHTDKTWEEYREEYLTPKLDSTDLTPEELEAHYYGLWQQQSTAPQVYRLTDDGKTCIDLPAEYIVDYAFDFCDDAALYGTMTSGINGQNTKAVRIDLNTGALQSVPLEPTERVLTCYDGALLTVRYVTDAPLPDDFEQYQAAVQSATLEFDRYDPHTGERSKLIERPYDATDERLSGYLGTHNGKLYFEEHEPLPDGGYSRGALWEYDPADGSTTTVWDAPPAGSPWDYQDTYTNVLPAHGSQAEGWLWLYGTDGTVGGNRCYLMNAATHELVPITQQLKNYTYDIPPSRLAQTADGRWLLWTEANDENAHVAYGLIDPDDFAKGSEAWTKVEMWVG